LTIACLARTVSVMSKSVSVIITDDLDGSENAETVSFAFDGVTYEIDLGKKNRSRLKRHLHPSSRLAGERRAAAAAVAPAALVAHLRTAAPCGPGPGRLA
jgi:nucleoid-associated protein Lsr2